MRKFSHFPANEFESNVKHRTTADVQMIQLFFSMEILLKDFFIDWYRVHLHEDCVEWKLDIEFTILDIYNVCNFHQCE